MVRMAVRVALGLAGAMSSPVLAQPCAEWVADGSPSPARRTQSAMVYDSGLGRLVLHAGGPLTGTVPIPRRDTWVWNGAAWLQVAIAGPARMGHAMAYDAGRGRTVLFGGIELTDGFRRQTWELDGSSWNNPSDTGPSERAWHAMAYDAARARTVLFGGLGPGAGGSGLLSDTWEWNGTLWTQRAVPGPSARQGHVLVYDPQRGVSVLFGGRAAGSVLGDTWEWNGTAWLQRAVTGPAPRYGHAAAYDPERARVVLFGGLGAGSGTVYNDTWEWDGVVWTAVVTTGHQANSGQSMAFAPMVGRMILMGGELGTDDQFRQLQRSAPVFTSLPEGLSRNVGQSAQFAAAVLVAGPRAYQWTKDGVPLVSDGRITGATTPAMAIEALGLDDAGVYAVTVTAACGPVTSTGAMLEVFCRVDWDRSGATEPADMAAFVNTWFADQQHESRNADFDGNGASEPADVAAFVNAWLSRLSGGPC